MIIDEMIDPELIKIRNKSGYVAVVLCIFCHKWKKCSPQKSFFLFCETVTTELIQKAGGLGRIAQRWIL